MSINMTPAGPRDTLQEALDYAKERLQEDVAEVRIEDLGDGHYRVSDIPQWVAQLIRKGESTRYVVQDGVN